MFRRTPKRPLFPPGALLVGGAVRDLLRGVQPKDFDWIAPDPERAARDLEAAGEGTAVCLDDERGFWRVVRHGETPLQHDFVPFPPEGLEADLRRRDFTVNALAMDARGEITDPAGGRADLRRRQLRMVSEANLRDDPLRALRAVRLELTLGFGLEGATEAAVRRVGSDQATGRLKLPAWERVGAEWEQLMRHPRAARGVARAGELGLLAVYLPELLEGIGHGQGGFHHLDVYHHNLEALARLLATFPQADEALRWAALLHDVAKPRCESVDERGHRHFYGHDRLGAEMTVKMLARLRLPLERAERAARLVRAHMLPLPRDPQAARRFAHRQRELLPDLLRLMLADREAARGPLASAAARLAYQQAMERVLAALEEQRQLPPQPLLRGPEVMELLGVPPGPVVGAALRLVAEARATGEVSTPAEARALVLTRAQDLRAGQADGEDD
ncbi:poly(A) polymerase [Deinobacterium chartae]|uniref:Poly(A) polymerase n=1 Tax=Deinobacterium chartae TaxID=521158 RepID=A0A841HYF0_9DEIO|nr:HD domain-containing protein [Deinobacterium chartae]MBB6097916.1 poly(A) polymerase [Deinobacterium chartae]